MWNGKKKAITFSYDDGVTQDIRLIELLNKYNLKCTFNLNYGKFGRDGLADVEGQIVTHNKVFAQNVRSLYEGHEIAAHGINHPHLELLSDEEVIYEVEEDRLRLSELCGYEVVGFAYPFGTYNERTIDVIRESTGVKYCRTVKSNYKFDLQEKLYEFHPSIHHIKYEKKAFELLEEFLSSDSDKPQLLYIWGHAYELDYKDSWGTIERFFSELSGHKDIFYGTNKEILL